MCDVYVDGVGYVCDNCEREFKIFLERNEIVPECESDFKMALKMFMKTEKDDFAEGLEMNLDEFFNQYRRKW
jgi:hypothetical protein